MGHLVTLTTCSLNQWALDFQGNADRILQSIKEAKATGSSLRIGPELEITGYGLLDHFLEADTDLHAWESLVQILEKEVCQDILLDIGMPVSHRNVRYNCRIISYNKQILLIRPKLSLANDGNYREMRYFSPWKRERYVEDYYLPRIAQKLTGQKKCRIGDALISTIDTCMGTETCEELFTPRSPGIGMGLDGCEIISNSSGSHHELRKLNTRIQLIVQETLKSGGIYLYANQQGCDGDRLYYDGSAMIVCNGQVVAYGSQFSLQDVETVTATVDLEAVRSYRTSKSRAMQAIKQPAYERIEVDMSLSKDAEDVGPRIGPSCPLEVRYHTIEEEIALGPACWLWDYLRRSKQAGFFLPLSGGIDSCATAVIVHSMCRLVYTDIVEKKNPHVLKDLLMIHGKPANSTWLPESPQEIAAGLFHSAYLGMEENSSPDTRKRAKDLAKEIGSYHLVRHSHACILSSHTMCVLRTSFLYVLSITDEMLQDLNIDTVYYAVTKLFTTVTAYVPTYGGTPSSNLALQNIQARLRMVLSYLFAQLLPTVRGRNTENPENKSPGGLLVLGSAYATSPFIK
jgi:NAD+ synthase (glutamine-hydrolysing)